MKSNMSKLTLWVDRRAIQFGKSLAKKKHESLSHLVTEYLFRLEQAEQAPALSTPLASKLIGILKKKPDIKDYYRYLEKKYL